MLTIFLIIYAGWKKSIHFLVPSNKRGVNIEYIIFPFSRLYNIIQELFPIYFYSYRRFVPLYTEDWHIIIVNKTSTDAMRPRIILPICIGV